MTYLLVSVMLATSLLALSWVRAEEDQSNQSDEQSIRQLMDKFATAVKDNEVKALHGMWAANYVFINPNGQVITKAQRLQAVGATDTKFDSISRLDISIRTYGDAAVVITRTTAKGKLRGKDLDAQFRGTSVLVKRQGQWQIVSQHDTILPP